MAAAFVTAMVATGCGGSGRVAGDTSPTALLSATPSATASSPSTSPSAAATRNGAVPSARTTSAVTQNSTRPATTASPTPASGRSTPAPTPRATRTGTSACAISGRTSSLTIVNQAVGWQFSPREVDVRCGTKVTVTNRSNADHTWTGSRWDSGNLAAGTGAYSYTFRYAGTFSFVCTYHATMTGKVVVSSP